jgi:hypothetical protein
MKELARIHDKMKAMEPSRANLEEIRRDLRAVREGRTGGA